MGDWCLVDGRRRNIRRGRGAYVEIKPITRSVSFIPRNFELEMHKLNEANSIGCFKHQYAHEGEARMSSVRS